MNLKGHQPSPSFLFSLDIGRSFNARKTHIRCLYDIMQLSLQRNDIPRALRAWTILSKCKEIDWTAMWPLAVHLLGGNNPQGRANSLQLDFLRDAMLQIPNDREAILKELVHRLVLSNRSREALEELELYLPAFPFQDNPIFHLYAALISLHLSHISVPDGDQGVDRASIVAESANQSTNPQDVSDSNFVREALAHLECAIKLNPNDLLLQTYKQKLHRFLQNVQSSQDQRPDSDEELDTYSIETPAKRSRT